MAILQASENRVFKFLQVNLGRVCSRDEIAQALWGQGWTQKYSDWMIDTLVYRLRHKIPANYAIKTCRNQGYALNKKGYQLEGSDPSNSVLKPVPGIQATEQYLNYMNNPANIRQGLTDLFKAAAGFKKYCRGRLLVINSYSFDNVDAVKAWPGEVVFIHHDERALDLHRRRAEELGLKHVSVCYDDIRQSRLADKTFNLVINDFRLNFNLTHRQNQQMMTQTRRVLKPGGAVLLSVVYGQRKRWFEGAEHLPRPCFPKSDYEKLFVNAGFKIVREFDREVGERWAKTIAVKTGWEPTFTRYLLK